MTILLFLGGAVLGVLLTLGGIGIGKALALRRLEREVWEELDTAYREYLEEYRRREESARRN